MRFLWVGLAALILGGATGAPGWAGEPRPDSGGPLHGAVVHGKALTFAVAVPEGRDEGSGAGWEVDLHSAAVSDGAAPQCFACEGSMKSLLRWHIAYKYAWISTIIYAGDSSTTHVGDIVNRYQLDGLLVGKNFAGPGAKDGLSDPDKFLGDILPLTFARAHGGLDRGDYDFHIHYDYLPTAEDEVRVFILCNVAGADETPAGPDGKSGNLSGFTMPYIDPRRDKPHWTLTEFKYHNTWDAEKKAWGEGESQRMGKIKVGFKEAFHVLGKGDDYYFVNVSGKLYRAPKPDKGADRKMETAWDDAKRPVVAFITDADADADRTFLFCKPDKDGKGVYFEMSDKPDPQPYDASKVPEAKADDPLPAVLAYAKVLLADKKIKDKE